MTAAPGTQGPPTVAFPGSVVVSATFPATPRARERAGRREEEGGVASQPASKKKAGPLLEPRAKCRRYSNQAVWVRPNCLRVLLTPCAPQTSSRRHKRQKAARVRAKCFTCALQNYCTCDFQRMKIKLMLVKWAGCMQGGCFNDINRCIDK